MAWLGGSGETMKRIDSSNGSNKTAAVATTAAQTGLGGEKMTVTTAAQAWLVIIRLHQKNNSECGSNGGGANVAWLHSSGKTAKHQQQQQRYGSSSDSGDENWTQWRRRRLDGRDSGGASQKQQQQDGSGSDRDGANWTRW